MRKNILIKTLMLSLMSIMTAQAQQLPYQDTSLSFHERAVDLVTD